MKTLRAVLLMEQNSGAHACQLASAAGITMNAEVVNNMAALSRAFENPPDLLLSFGTSVIVPASFLESPDLLALNVHAASPDYPGRDPHHFAVYDGVKLYGATMHFMTSQVDAGQIVNVRLFDVPAGITPVHLLEMANEAAWALIERLFVMIASGAELQIIPGIFWGQRKTTRKMFLELCRVDSSISKTEFSRRLLATSMPGYDNLYVELHGYRFRMNDDK
jgi:methionyl-tRNA formyltransferase